MSILKDEQIISQYEIDKARMFEPVDYINQQEKYQCDFCGQMSIVNDLMAWPSLNKVSCKRCNSKARIEAVRAIVGDGEV